MKEGSEVKRCGKCNQKVPPGLLICVVCALQQSNAPSPLAAAAELQGSAVNLTHRSALAKIGAYFPKPDRSKPKSEPMDLLEGIPSINL